VSTQTEIKVLADHVGQLCTAPVYYALNYMTVNDSSHCMLRPKECCQWSMWHNGGQWGEL